MDIRKVFNSLISITIIGLLIAPLSFSEQGQNQIYEMPDFSGGLNTQASDTLIQPNQGTVCQNIRFNDMLGAISKRKKLLSYGAPGSYAVTGMHRYYNSSGDEYLIASGSTYLKRGNDTTGAFTVIKQSLTDGERWQFTTYKDILIGMNGADNPIKYDGHTVTTANTDGARTANCLCADLGAPFVELNTGSNLTASKWYQYKVAFYDGTTYSYSNARSNPIATGSTVRDISLTGIPLGPAGTTARYVYRTLGAADQATVEASSTFYKVATISDNTTTTLNDAMSDATASGDAAPTWSTVSAGTNVSPPKGDYCTIHKERLFISGNSTNQSDVYFSASYNPEYFDPTDYIEVRPDDGDKVTFMKSQGGILFIGKTNTIQAFYTERSVVDDWKLSDPLSHIGCPAPYSAVNSPTGIIYLSRNGIYNFNGNSSTLISDAVTPEIKDILPANIDDATGVFFNNEYRLAYTSLYSGESSNNRVLVFDMVRNAYSIDIMDVNSFCVFNSGTDTGILYLGSSASTGYIYADDESDLSVRLKLKSQFDAGTYDDARTTGTEKNPEVEIAWTITIDEAVGTIDTHSYGATAIIDRQDTDGTWTSAVYQIDSGVLDELKWNEDLGTTGDITIAIRTGATATPDGTWSSWSSEFTTPTGSDISGVTTNTYIQMRASLSTTNINYSPTLYLANGYVIKMTYSRPGTAAETAISSIWKSGLLNLGISRYQKHIKNIMVFYEGTSGTLNFGYEDSKGNQAGSFNIDLAQSPPYDSSSGYYRGTDTDKSFLYYMPVNTLIGEYFKFTLTEEGAKNFKVKKIMIIFDLLSIGQK